MRHVSRQSCCGFTSTAYDRPRPRWSPSAPYREPRTVAVGLGGLGAVSPLWSAAGSNTGGADADARGPRHHARGGHYRARSRRHSRRPGDAALFAVEHRGSRQGDEPRPGRDIGDAQNPRRASSPSASSASTSSRRPPRQWACRTRDLRCIFATTRRPTGGTG